jgi:hypothetical protein
MSLLTSAFDRKRNCAHAETQPLPPFTDEHAQSRRLRIFTRSAERFKIVSRFNTGGTTMNQQEADAARVKKLKLLGIVIGIIIVIPILAWKWGLI